MTGDEDPAPPWACWRLVGPVDQFAERHRYRLNQREIDNSMAGPSRAVNLTTAASTAAMSSEDNTPVKVSMSTTRLRSKDKSNNLF
jgi:hypothetical protein